MSIILRVLLVICSRFGTYINFIYIYKPYYNHHLNIPLPRQCLDLDNCFIYMILLCNNIDFPQCVIIFSKESSDAMIIPLITILMMAKLYKNE